MAPDARLRARPAHAPGATFTTYTPNGKKLLTVGNNSVIRVFTTGSDAEPVNIDVPQEAHTAVAATNDFFITGAEDGTVCKYSLSDFTLDEILLRCTLPVRDLALSPDGLWVAVASEYVCFPCSAACSDTNAITSELVVKVVNTQDMSRVLYLREQNRPVKHVSFDHSGSSLAVSCSDGVVYVYSVTYEEPKLVKRLDGLVMMLETESELGSKVIWHPDGRALAAPTATRGQLDAQRCLL